MPLPRDKYKYKKSPKSRATNWRAMKKNLSGSTDIWQKSEILNLNGWRTVEYLETSEIHVFAESTINPVCPRCETDSNLSKWGFAALKRFYDLPFHCKPVFVYYLPQRFFCFNCRTTVIEPIVGINVKYRSTKRLVEYLENESFNPRLNFTDLARLTRVDRRQIATMFTDRAEFLERNRVIKTPEWLAIDEVHPYGRKSSYCVISDPLESCVIDMLPVNSQIALFKWLIQLPQRDKVKVVSVDLYPAYRSAIKRALPNAEIVADRYHIHSLLNSALKSLLIAFRSNLTQTEAAQILPSELLLLKSRRKLSASQRAVLNKQLKKLPPLETGYRLKESFFDLLQLSSVQTADEQLEQWLIEVLELDQDLKSQSFIGSKFVLAMIDAQMLFVSDINQTIVTTPAVRMRHRIERNAPTNDSPQRFRKRPAQLWCKRCHFV